MAVSRSVSPPICSRTGRGIPGEDLDAADGLEQRLALDGQRVGMAGRDELAVVGELAFDQPRRQPRVADLERRVALAEAQRELVAAADQPLQLVERTTGHEHLLVGAEHADDPARSRTASRYESVATMRRPSFSAVSSTPVRIGRASSVLAARTTWRKRFAELPPPAA